MSYDDRCEVLIHNTVPVAGGFMARRGSAFAGLSVALTTPFKDGQLDLATLRQQVEFQIEAGTVCLVPVGTTGESPTLSHEEHERVISEVVQAVAGRVKVMPGTGSNSTAEALRLTRWAAKEGADAALMVAPYYNKPTQEGFYQHYRAVAESVEIPICVYNIPGRTGRNIEPETFVRMAEVPNITLVKEATGSLDQASQILAETDLTLLSGDDSLTLPLLSVGGEGVISVVGNIVPRDMIALVRSFQDGQLQAAQQWHLRLFSLCRDLLSLATNPIPIKAAMQLLERDTGELRLPMTPLDAAGLQRLHGTPDRVWTAGMSDRDFDIDSLACYLHLKPQQVERLVTRGKLPGRRVGGKWRFSAADIHHWMEKRMGLLEDNELAQVEGALARADNLQAEDVSIAEALHERTIRLPLQARTKSSVIDEMTQLAASTGLLWDPQTMAEAIRSREQLHSTALDNGVALMHPRRPLSSIMAEPVLAIGISPQGIPFGGRGPLTDVFFLICSTDDRGHLRTLARLSRLIGSDELLEALRQAPSAATVYELICQAEQQYVS